MPDGVDQSHVSLDWGMWGQEGVDDVGRREASLMTSAMSGSAIRIGVQSPDTRVVREGGEGMIGENKRKAEGNRGRRVKGCNVL